MRYEFIAAQKANFPVLMLCKMLEVSRAGFYAWRARPESKRARDDRELGKTIAKIHTDSRGTYGSPRVYAELKDRDLAIGKKRVARIMRENGIKARRRRPFKPQTTDSNHAHPVPENVLARDFTRSAPNKAWVGDITYVQTGEGWLYLAVLLDLHSRMVVGWAMSQFIDRHLVLDTLSMAVTRRGVPEGGVLHHSDRGSQYACEDYRKALARYGFQASMSRKGNCWDNAVAESFNSTIKTELIYQRNFTTRNEARQAIFEYIEVFYNRQRRHSSLGYLSPLQYEAKTTGAIRPSA